jgi:alanine racemase
MAGDAPVAVNFKIDTGMGRMGVPENEALELFKKVSALRQIRIHSVSTHLPVSNEDAEYTRDELLRFGNIVKQFRAAIPGVQSTCIAKCRRPIQPEGFRHGACWRYALWVSPLPEFQNLLRPAMAWKRNCARARYAEGSSVVMAAPFTPENADRNVIGWCHGIRSNQL